MQGVHSLGQARIQQEVRPRFCSSFARNGPGVRRLRVSCQAVRQSALTELKQLVKAVERELKVVTPKDAVSEPIVSKEKDPVEVSGETSKSAPKPVPQATTPRNLVFVTSEVIDMLMVPTLLCLSLHAVP